jgi:LmbE family N-acetylglucosaminyl deacetylase
MPTDRASALFLFAHQDDEFGVFQVIEDCLRQGMRVRCAYLTHGANGSAATRNAESLAVLGQLGVARDDIFFAGDQLGICDARLSRHMAAAGAEQVALVCLPAWEGGHHDHDALHVLGLHTAERLGLGGSVRQYALYNAFRCPGPFFRVMSPLAANGARPIQVTRCITCSMAASCCSRPAWRALPSDRTPARCITNAASSTPTKNCATISNSGCKPARSLHEFPIE